MTQYYRIADLTVALDSFGRTLAQSEPYRIMDDGNVVPDIQVVSNYQELKKNQPHLSEDDSEYISTCGNFYRQLISFEGMMLHASAVMMDGKAYLFSAPSGMGKSTHTTLWQKVFGEDRVRILNDDKPALRRIDGRWYAFGTPWSGKYDISVNEKVQLAGICMLGRGEENKIERYIGPKAIHAILEQTLRPKNPELMQKLLNLLDELMSEVPVWKMECNMDDGAALMSHRVMSGEE